MLINQSKFNILTEFSGGFVVERSFSTAFSWLRREFFANLGQNVQAPHLLKDEIYLGYE